MGKGKNFIKKGEKTTTFKLVPGYEWTEVVEDTSARDGTFHPDEEHLKKQRDCGIFFDDDYNYLKHLRSRESKAVLVGADEFGEEDYDPLPFNVKFGNIKTMKTLKERKAEEELDEEVAEVLNTANTESCDVLEDNFLELAGGIPMDSAFNFRDTKIITGDSDEEESDSDNDLDLEDDEPNYNHGARYEYSGNMDDEGYEATSSASKYKAVGGHTYDRDYDQNFESMLEQNYNDDQMGELEHDDFGEEGFLEPNDPRIFAMIKRKRAMPKYDDEEARELVLERLTEAIENGVDPLADKEEETEVVELDQGSKRLKWDCESFATQYSNIYNHPTKICQPRSKLSKRALRQLEKMSQVNEESDVDMDDEEMEDDCESVMSTISTFRPKGETPEQRRLRKAAVKEAQRVRREEKKQNKKAFAEEYRRQHKSALSRLPGNKIV